MKKFVIKRWHRARGLSTVELALVLPILLVLLLGVVDFGRAILFNNILINMSREGANLASRTSQAKPFIISTLNSTSSPLKMALDGMVYIAMVQGVADGTGGVAAIVQEQYRATSGDTSLASKFWSCSAWSSGTCNMAASPGSAVGLPMPLAIGEKVYVVEALYNYKPLTSYVMSTDIVLYSRTLL